MSDFSCVRCGSEQQQAAPPMPGPAGVRMYEQICAGCWKEWLEHQTALINHYALDLRNPEARTFLTEQSEQFLFAAPKDQNA
jgi:Fe-S cluster biosynthesis and repair protein YggX